MTPEVAGWKSDYPFLQIVGNGGDFIVGLSVFLFIFSLLLEFEKVMWPGIVFVLVT
jgi:hypothetical protein